MSLIAIFAGANADRQDTKDCSNVDAMCKKNPLFVLIIGNVPAARKLNDPDQEWSVVAAAVTRAQSRKRGDPRPLKVKKMTSRMTVDKEELIRLQDENSTQQN